MRRVTAGVIGFLVAPLISSIIVAATTPLFRPFDVMPRMAMLPVFYYFSAAAAVVIGLPAFLILFHFGLITWWSSIAVGLTVGVLVAVVVSGIQPLAALLFMAATGAASTLAFWLIWRLGRDGDIAK